MNSHPTVVKGARLEGGPPQCLTCARKTALEERRPLPRLDFLDAEDIRQIVDERVDRIKEKDARMLAGMELLLLATAVYCDRCGLRLEES